MSGSAPPPGGRLTLLVLSDETYPRHRGGSGKCCHLMAAGIAARGHSVHLLSLTDGPPVRELIDGVEVHRVEDAGDGAPSSRQSEAATARHLLSYVRREIPPASLDLVHDGCGFMSYFFPLAYALKRQHGLPLAVHFRYLLARHQMVAEPRERFDPFAPRVLGLEACIGESTQCFPVRIADLVLSPSRRDAELIEELYRPAPGTLRVIPDPVRLAAPDPAVSGITRNRLARPGESLVLFGGRVGSDLKGADVVLDAFRHLGRRGDRVRLLLATSDEETVEVFRRRLGAAVTPLGWIGEEAELAAVLRAVDVVLMPSRYESFGLMCAEAMTAGTPVIGAPVGGLPEMIADGENGFLLRGSEPAGWGRELADRLLELLGDRERLARMGARARESAERELGTERTCERLESCYRELAARRPAHGEPIVRPPGLSAGDRERYLRLLAEHGGAHARAAGAEVLPRWTVGIETRCLACSRQQIAEHTRDLQRLGRRRPAPLAGNAAARHRRAVATVAPACPLALLQKGRVSVGGEGGER